MCGAFSYFSWPETLEHILKCGHKALSLDKPRSLVAVCEVRLGAGSRSDLVDQTLPTFQTLALTPVGFLQNFHNLIVYNRREGWDDKSMRE